MIDKNDTSNFLMEIVKKERLNRKSQFKQLNNVNEKLADFPNMHLKHTLDALKNKIAFGSYQMSFCLSYLSENFKEHKSFKIALYKDNYFDSKIITSKIKSRHSSSRDYRVFICYSSCDEI